MSDFYRIIKSNRAGDILLVASDGELECVFDVQGIGVAKLTFELAEGVSSREKLKGINENIIVTQVLRIVEETFGGE